MDTHLKYIYEDKLVVVVLASNPIGETEAEDLNLNANLRSPCLGFLRTGRLFQKMVAVLFPCANVRLYIKKDTKDITKQNNFQTAVVHIVGHRTLI